MSDILIRGLSDGAVSEIDRMVKEINKKNKNIKMSRNDFLKIHLENLATTNTLRELEDKFSSIIKINQSYIDMNSKILSAIATELSIDLTKYIYVKNESKGD